MKGKKYIKKFYDEQAIGMVKVLNIWNDNRKNIFEAMFEVNRYFLENRSDIRILLNHEESCFLIERIEKLKGSEIDKYV